MHLAAERSIKWQPEASITSTSPSPTSTRRWPSTSTFWGRSGWPREVRYPTYRGTEEVVYLVDAHDRRGVGLRPADGGTHSYYNVGIEHLAFEVDSRDEVDAAYGRCLARRARIHFPPEEDRDEYHRQVDPGYYAFFVFDPDGMRIEVFCWPRADL
jgi:catechol 2,3-dioxygenase-like lactoylglutathione lyase family enzyme